MFSHSHALFNVITAGKTVLPNTNSRASPLALEVEKVSKGLISHWPLSSDASQHGSMVSRPDSAHQQQVTYLRCIHFPAGRTCSRRVRARTIHLNRYLLFASPISES